MVYYLQGQGSGMVQSLILLGLGIGGIRLSFKRES